MAPRGTQIRNLAIPAVAAAALTLLFALGAGLIPRFAEKGFRAGLGRPVSLANVSHFLREGENLDEVEAFLQQLPQWRIEHFTLMAQLVEARDGPNAAYEFFVDYLGDSRRTSTDRAALYVELARLALAAEAWDDAFNILMLLHDYGEVETVRALLDGASKTGADLREAFRSSQGVRAIAHMEWDPSAFQVREAYPWLLDYLQLERSILFNEAESAESDANDLLQRRPDDPRAQALMQYIRNPDAENPRIRIDRPKLLEPRQFQYPDAGYQNGRFLGSGVLSAELPEARNAIWLAARPSDVLGVYPLLFVRLDGAPQVLYLPFNWTRPILLQRADEKPFRSIQLQYANRYRARDLNQDRLIDIDGIYTAEAGEGSAESFR